MENNKSIPHDEAMLSYFTNHPERAVEMVNELTRQANELEDQRDALAAWIADMFSQEAVGYPFIMMSKEARERCSTTEGVIEHIKEELERTCTT